MDPPDVVDSILAQPMARRWLQREILAKDGHSIQLLEMVLRQLVALADRGDEEAIVRVGYLRSLAGMEVNLNFLHGMLSSAAESLIR